MNHEILLNKLYYEELNFIGVNPLYDETNKKVIGKFKNESPNKQIIKFVGLRSKMYSYLTDNNTNVKKCKGIKKCVVDEMNHEDYNRCLKEKEIIRKSQKIFKSKLHKVYTVEVNKIALSFNDD